MQPNTLVTAATCGPDCSLENALAARGRRLSVDACRLDNLAQTRRSEAAFIDPTHRLFDRLRRRSRSDGCR